MSDVVKIVGQHGFGGLGGINIRIAAGDGSSSEALDDRLTKADGSVAFTFRQSSANDRYTLYINEPLGPVNPDWGGTHVAVQFPLPDDYEIGLARTPRPRLHVQDRVFVDPDGRRVFIKGHTDFLLYKRLLDGESIDPILQERASFGSNCARMLGMVQSFADWWPQTYGDRYYDRLPEPFEKLDQYGMWGYFTIFADTQIIMPKRDNQLRHYDKVRARLEQIDNSLIEFVNEPFAHDNATTDPNAFTKPQGVPYSTGSYDDRYGDKVTPKPHGDFHDMHTPRDKSHVKAIADQCMTPNPNYQAGQAVFSGEPDKFGGPNAMNAKVYLTDPVLARAMAGTARGTAAGIIYHTSAGVWSLPWNQAEKDCAAAWFAELA